MAIVKAAVAVKPVEMTRDEVEFKAEFFHKLWISQKTAEGKHWIAYHANPMMSPPPLRADGKSRCDDCLLNMAPYSELPEKVKDLDRRIVLNIQNAEIAWRNRG